VRDTPYNLAPSGIPFLAAFCIHVVHHNPDCKTSCLIADNLLDYIVYKFRIAISKEEYHMSRHLLILFIVLALAAGLLAEVPHTISYQGRLTDNGIPVNGLKSVTFTIYNAGGVPVWNSGTVNVAFTDGLFTIELGQSPQPSLPLEIWPADTAMSLGVTIETNPELSPRLHFKTVPYAMHAMTAESAGSGGGWMHRFGRIFLEDSTELVGIGTSSSLAKVGVASVGEQVGLEIVSEGSLLINPTMDLTSMNNTCAIFRSGTAGGYPMTPRPAMWAVSNLADGSAAWFENASATWPALYIEGQSSGGGLYSYSASGYCVDTWGGKGIRAVADSATAIRAESNYSGNAATVLAAVYTGTASHDHIAVSGYSRPADFYGVGGRFEGGYCGVLGYASPGADGNKWYIGLRGEANGGMGTNYGIYGSAGSGVNNYGVYGVASGGAESWAGYFDGDVNVTGNIVKSASTLAIDNPIDPDNSVLQQAEVVSDNQTAIYSGNAILDGNGSAVVQLPNYLESFCGDFRYQLTCIGGYAPVYVSSEISGNQFIIAGGKDGLKVSWQITGIRKDRYAQANPLEVEKKKTATEQGKYLHPELYGYSADRSLSPNPDRDPSMKAKNDAVREASAALTKPSTQPQQPIMMEKK
jgi:hypothetical protein